LRGDNPQALTTQIHPVNVVHALHRLVRGDVLRSKRNAQPAVRVIAMLTLAILTFGLSVVGGFGTLVALAFNWN